MAKWWQIFQSFSIGDPDNPQNVLRPQADGSIDANVTVNATIGDFALANAVAPTWVEGAPVEASVDLSGNQRTRNDLLNALVGPVNETASATDTASSGLNGRLQRIAQRLTTIFTALFGTAGTPSASVISVQGISGGTILSTQTSFLFQNLTGSATTTVKSGAGVLRGVTINQLGSVASTVTIYDNTAGSGTKIGTINSLTLSGQFEYDVAFATGLTIVTTGSPDITVSYR